MSKVKNKVESFRKQMAQSMSELDSIMNSGQSINGDSRFTVRTIRVTEPSDYRPSAIREIRNQLGVSQAVFAQLLGVSQVLVRSWERGVRAPAAIARRLLDVIRDNPKSVTSLIRTLPAGAGQSSSKTVSKRASSRSRRASAA